MNRREFVNGMVAGAVGLALSGRASGIVADSNNAGASPMELGIQLYSVREECQRDLPGTLKALSGMGYSEVEFFTFYGKTATQIRKVLSETGLKCRSAHYQYPVLAGS